MKAGKACPCGSGATYQACCGRFIDDGAAPETAEELMRSRYTAYTLDRADYLVATWHPTTRRRELHLEEPVSWIGLRVVATEGGGPDDREGRVEFVARYKIGGRAHRLHETSRFLRREGRWYYVDGDLDPAGS